jgi:hypothetical protein
MHHLLANLLRNIFGWLTGMSFQPKISNSSFPHTNKKMIDGPKELNVSGSGKDHGILPAIWKFLPPFLPGYQKIRPSFEVTHTNKRNFTGRTPSPKSTRS